jgi:YD repeat-containing protein
MMRSFAAVLLMSVSIPVFGQAAPGVYADANLPSGAPDPMKLDLIWQVDNLTGALSVKIPFPTEPMGGRGPRIPFTLLYNSAATVTLQETSSYNIPSLAPVPGAQGNIIQSFTWMPGSYNTPTGPVGPWTTTGPFFTTSSNTIQNQVFQENVNGNNITVNNGSGCSILGPYLYSDLNGATHDLNLVFVSGLSASPATPCTTYNNVLVGMTSDGSAIQSSALRTAPIGDTTVNGVTPQVIYPDGTQDYGNGLLEDTNGNQSSIASDSEGRAQFTTNMPIGKSGEIPTGTYSVTTTSSTGTSEPYSIIVSSIRIGAYSMPHPVGNGEFTNIGFCSPNCPTEFSAVQVPSGSAVNAITSIKLPNDTTYAFTYDPTYGTISKITFPTGGYVRFVYGIRSDGGGYGAFLHRSTIIVTDAYIFAGSGAEQHWSYNFPAYAYGSGQLTSTVTAPDATLTQYSGFGLIFNTVFNVGAAPSWLETRRLISNSCGKLVQSVETAYSSGGGGLPASPYNTGSYVIPSSLPSQITTTNYDGSTPVQKQVRFQYDLYSNVIEKDESDFYGCTGSPCPVAAAPPSGWLRRTFTTYQYQSTPSWVKAHIVDKPSQVLVTDGVGHPYVLAQYGYDYNETNLSGSSGIMNHDDQNYPASSSLPRGNVTSEAHCSGLSNTAIVTPVNAATACSTWLTTSHTYDLTGQRVKTTDPRGYSISYGYSDTYLDGSPPKQTNGYLTLVKYANGASDSYSYYYDTGQVASHTDWNSKTTQYTYDTSMNRLLETAFPDGGSVQINYNGDPAPPYITTTTATGESAGPIVHSNQYDGLGRLTQGQLTSDPAGTDYVDTTYDLLGRVSSVSNPYRVTGDPISSAYPSDGITSYSYDALNRKILQIQPDSVTTSAGVSCQTPAVYSSAQQWNYAGNTVTSTDEVGNQWQRTTDGLGRLTRVLEPNGAAQSPTLETDYTYDPLGDLTSVSQCGGTCPSAAAVVRTFAYDGLSRLIQSFNPETGWTCYGTTGGAASNGSNCTSGYDGNGNLTYKTDARGVLVNYSYDGLNRVLAKWYSNDPSKTPTSCYQYDLAAASNGMGRLWNEWTQRASAGTCATSPPTTGVLTRRSILLYDSMGRIQSEQQCTPSNCATGTPYAPAYTYDLAGNVQTFTNGITSTPTVNTLSFVNAFDAAGRLLTLTSNWSDATHPSALFSAQTKQSPPCGSSLSSPYAPFGGLANATFGNGLSLNRSYDNRLRTTCEIDTGSATAGSTSASATVTVSGSEQSQ